MTGEVHWLPLAVVMLAAALPAWLWIRDRREGRKYLVEHGCVRCREKDNSLVQCTVVRDPRTRKPIGIRTCTAHRNIEDVRCAKSCLKQFEPTARSGA